MTVQELLRAYFGLTSTIHSIIVQRNNSGRLEKLYSSNDGYDERYMRPEVRTAEIISWGVDISKTPRIWITVE